MSKYFSKTFFTELITNELVKIFEKIENFMEEFLFGKNVEK